MFLVFCMYQVLYILSLLIVLLLYLSYELSTINTSLKYFTFMHLFFNFPIFYAPSHFIKILFHKGMVFMFISCSSYVFSFCVCSMFGHVLVMFCYSDCTCGSYLKNIPQMSHVVHILCIAVWACFEFCA